jgi:hypothetical protein
MSAQPKARAVTARYDTRGAGDPPNGLARVSPSLIARTRVGAVADPIPGSPDNNARHNARVAVRVNITTDLLELEHAHDRISPQAYKCGRFLMALFERAHGLKRDASNLEPRDSADQTYGHEAQIIRALDTAADVVWWSQQIQAVIGSVGLRLLRQVLDEGKTFRDIAGGMVASERQIGYAADRFRWALESLAKELGKDNRR